MPVLYERRGAAAILTIDRPDRRNAVDRDTAEALRGHFREFVADGDARVLIVTGANNTFCAGADLKAMNNPAAAPEGPMGFTRLASPKPTIAAVEGWCVAGGLEIACWCDVRIAARSAVFGCFERRWGVPLIDGGTVRLPRLIGESRAMDLILTGRPVDASEALAIGLVNRVVPEAAFETELDALVERLANASPLALKGMKANFVDQERMGLAEFLAAETARHNACGRSEDSREAFRAFVEKRKPVYQGR